MSRSVLRTELKYLLSPSAAMILERRLAAFLSSDPFSVSEDGYFIRSLYYDDLNESAYYDKLSGMPERTKYRIRFYNFDDSFIQLEKKEKHGEKTRKKSERLSRGETERILSGSVSFLLDSDRDLMREFGAKFTACAFHPAVLVDYQRKAFLHPFGDTRITFDSCVRATSPGGPFFKKSRQGIPVLDFRETILEIKYNDFLMPAVSDLLSGVPMIRCSNSKYCRCLAALHEE